MKSYSMPLIHRVAVAAVLAVSLAFTTAQAQTAPAPKKPSAPTHATGEEAPTNAELKQEIESLREQVRQLQQAQKVPAQAQRDSKPGASQTQKGPAMGKQMDQQGMGMGMDKKKRGMGMMEKDMDKDMDDSMEMPPPDKKPDSMSDGMPHM